ncbi:class I SAM-dependent methyltransferase, partial [Nostocoides jenkinsii]|uniref:class I SAM-dependent methyltransferase n=1 Tax=Nostocoides jenkinsii TaxID=330834 RepID=UPI001F2D0356
MVATTVRPSPNIWDHPDTYELESLAFDREQQIEALLEILHPYAAATLLDVGCGTGFHLPRFAARGARVLGVEPHPPLAARAWARVLASVAG